MIKLDKNVRVKGEAIVKQIPTYFISLLSLIILLCGCSLNSDQKIDLFQYNEFILWWDNSAVGNIVKQLAHNKELNKISLDTKKEPYENVLWNTRIWSTSKS